MNDYHTNMPATVPMMSAYTISSQISINADKISQQFIKKDGHSIIPIENFIGLMC